MRIMQRNWWIRSHWERCFFSQWHRWLGIKIRILPTEVEILTSVLLYTSPAALPQSDKRPVGAKANRLGSCDKQSLQISDQPPKPATNQFQTSRHLGYGLLSWNSINEFYPLKETRSCQFSSFLAIWLKESKSEAGGRGDGIIKLLGVLLLIPAK